MRVEQLSTGGEGELFVFTLRPGVVLLRALAAGAALCGLATLWDFEMIFVAGALGAGALLSWPILRWGYWGETAIAVTTTQIRPLTSRDPKDARASFDIDPAEPVITTLGRTVRRENGGTTKFRNVEHAGQVIVYNLASNYEAKQIAKTLNEAISDRRAGPID